MKMKTSCKFCGAVESCYYVEADEENENSRIFEKFMCRGCGDKHVSKQGKDFSQLKPIWFAMCAVGCRRERWSHEFCWCKTCAKPLCGKCILANHEEHDLLEFMNPPASGLLILSPHEAKLEWERREILLSPLLSDELRSQRTKLLETFQFSWDQEELHSLARNDHRALMSEYQKDSDRRLRILKRISFAEESGVSPERVGEAAEKVEENLRELGVGAHPVCSNFTSKSDMDGRVPCSLCKVHKSRCELFLCKETYKILCSSCSTNGDKIGQDYTLYPVDEEMNRPLLPICDLQVMKGFHDKVQGLLREEITTELKQMRQIWMQKILHSHDKFTNEKHPVSKAISDHIHGIGIRLSRQEQAVRMFQEILEDSFVEVMPASFKDMADHGMGGIGEELRMHEAHISHMASSRVRFVDLSLEMGVLSSDILMDALAAFMVFSVGFQADWKTQAASRIAGYMDEKQGARWNCVLGRELIGKPAIRFTGQDQLSIQGNNLSALLWRESIPE